MSLCVCVQRQEEQSCPPICHCVCVSRDKKNRVVHQYVVVWVCPETRRTELSTNMSLCVCVQRQEEQSCPPICHCVCVSRDKKNRVVHQYVVVWVCPETRRTELSTNISLCGCVQRQEEQSCPPICHCVGVSRESALKSRMSRTQTNIHTHTSSSS